MLDRFVDSVRTFADALSTFLDGWMSKTIW
jgi:hypothetical protein